MGAKIPEWDEKGVEIQVRWGFGCPMGKVMDRGRFPPQALEACAREKG